MAAFDVLEGYNERAITCADFGPVVEHLIRQLIAAAGVRIHSVNHRIKAQESFQRKVSQEGARYTAIDDVHDLLGVRVITYFPDEVDLVADIVEREFTVDLANSVDKRALLDPDRFGYLSLHYVVSLSEERTHLAEYTQFAGLKLEIQVRSILQHAWAEIEHDLGYQSRSAIPKGIRRRFSRLAGLLEIADSEFQSLREDVGEYQETVEKQVTIDSSDLPIDRDTVAAYVTTAAAVSQIDDFIVGHLGKMTLQPITPMYAGSRATELKQLGLVTIGDIDRELTSRAEVIKRFFELWTTPGRIDDVSQGISLFYLMWVLLGSLQDRERVMEFLDQHSFNRPGDVLADRALSIYTDATK